MISKIVSNFSTYTDSDFETAAQAIEAAMTGNLAFPAPVPDLASLTTAVAAYSSSLTVAQNRDRNAVAIKSQLRAELEFLLSKLAGYVTATALGDNAKLVSSAYPMRKTSGSLGVTKPENLQVTNGPNPGELELRVKVYQPAIGTKILVPCAGAGQQRAASAERCG